MIKFSKFTEIKFYNIFNNQEELTATFNFTQEEFIVITNIISHLEKMSKIIDRPFVGLTTTAINPEIHQNDNVDIPTDTALTMAISPSGELAFELKTIDNAFFYESEIIIFAEHELKSLRGEPTGTDEREDDSTNRE